METNLASHFSFFSFEPLAARAESRFSVVVERLVESQSRPELGRLAILAPPGSSVIVGGRSSAVVVCRRRASLGGVGHRRSSVVVRRRWLRRSSLSAVVVGHRPSAVEDKAHVNSRVFSLCLASWGGELTVGGYDPSCPAAASGARGGWWPGPRPQLP